MSLKGNNYLSKEKYFVYDSENNRRINNPMNICVCVCAYLYVCVFIHIDKENIKN